jgi:hypothetical protein
MNAATKGMLTAMFAVMDDEDIRQVQVLARKRRNEINTLRNAERRLKQQAAAEKRSKELRDREAWNRANIKPGDWIRLEYDEERDKPPEAGYGIVERVNRINIKYKPVRRRLKVAEDGSKTWVQEVPAWATSQAHQVKFCIKIDDPNNK